MARMSRRLQRQVAESLDAPEALLPVLPEIFAGLSALGNSPRRVVSWLRAAGMGAGDTLLDLGCGKGAVSVSAAASLGCSVIGVDGMPKFVESARAEAARRGVSALCRFECGDLNATRRAPSADAVLVIGVLPVEEALEVVRPRVRRGGVYIVDDAVLLESARSEATLPGGARPTRRGVREAMERGGDTVLREYIMPPGEYRRMETAIFASIKAAGKRLVRKRPELAQAVAAYLEDQRCAGAMLWHGPWRAAVWMAQRGGRRA